MKTREACSKEHDFTLVLAGIPELTSQVGNALFEAGCDDATVSMRLGAYLSISHAALLP